MKDNNFIPLFGKVLSRDFLEGYPVSLYLVRDFGTKTEPNRYSLMRIDNLEAVEIVNGIYTDNKKVLQASNFDIYFYDKKGLYKIPTQTKTLVQIAPNVFNGILSSYKDHNGRFWVGTEEGLVQFSSDAFITYPKKKLEYTWSILEDKKGVMWFASYGHGLKKLERDSIVEVTEHLKLSPKLQKTFYMGAAKAKNGDLVFTMSAGLLKYDGQEFSVLDTNTNLI